MTQYQSIAERISQAIAPVVEHAGFELVLVECLKQGNTLRLYIDKEGGISLSDCSAVSRLISDVLDAEGDAPPVDAAADAALDPQLGAAPEGPDAAPTAAADNGARAAASAALADLGGRYTLEVSSPGLDRPLVKPSHFARFVGQQVQLQVLEADSEAGPRRHKCHGTLAQALPTGIVLSSEAGEQAFDYAHIHRARLVPTYERH